VAKPCSHCGRAWSADGWSELALLDRITSDRVREFVTSWLDCEVVEVRTCVCGRALARKVSGMGSRSPAGAREVATNAVTIVTAKTS
jgi:hypothetical protein